MLVKLSSVANSDFGQKKTPAPTQIVEVKSLEEASQVCREYISQYQLGGGNWTGGQVTQDGKETHHISYNGRIWES